MKNETIKRHAVEALMHQACQGRHHVSIERDGHAVLHAHPQHVCINLDVGSVQVDDASARVVITLTMPGVCAGVQVPATAVYNPEVRCLDLTGDGWHGTTGRVGAYAHRLRWAAFRRAIDAQAALTERNAAALASLD